MFDQETTLMECHDHCDSCCRVGRVRNLDLGVVSRRAAKIMFEHMMPLKANLQCWKQVVHVRLSLCLPVSNCEVAASLKSRVSSRLYRASGSRQTTGVHEDGKMQKMASSTNATNPSEFQNKPGRTVALKLFLRFCDKSHLGVCWT